jgi:hypothetical protein
MVFFDADDVVREREAMAAVSKALESLDQPSARQRVLRWAAQTFQVDLSASTDLPEIAGAPLIAQETAPNNPEKIAAAEQVRGKEPVDELFRELAADYQRLALERHGA